MTSPTTADARPVRVYCHPGDVRRVRVLLGMAGVSGEVRPSPAALPGRPYPAPHRDRTALTEETRMTSTDTGGGDVR